MILDWFSFLIGIAAGMAIQLTMSIIVLYHIKEV